MGMNPEVKTEWLEALRSGRYTQGNNQLRSDRGEYCCLGVLCDVWVRKGEARQVGGTQFEILNYTNYSWLSGHALDKAGLTEHDQTQLIDLNDGQRATFTEIADWIEANL